MQNFNVIILIGPIQNGVCGFSLVGVVLERVYCSNNPIYHLTPNVYISCLTICNHILENSKHPGNNGSGHARLVMHAKIMQPLPWALEALELERGNPQASTQVL